MKIVLNFKHLLAFYLLVILTTSCLSDVDLLHISKDAKIDESLVLPIGEANMSIKDMFKKWGMPTNIDTLSNEIYYTTTGSSEFSFHPFSLVDSLMPYSKTIHPFATPVVIPANTSIEIPSVTDVLGLGVNSNVSTQRVDIAKINSSTVNISVNVSPDLANIPPQDFTLEFVFPTNKLSIANGVTPTYIPTAYGQYEQIYIGNYTIYAAGLTTIPFTINVSVKKQNFPLNLGPNSYISINLNFSQIDLYQAWGLFKMNINNSRIFTLPFKIDDFLPNSFLRFSNPTVDVTASSNIGADLLFSVDYVKAYNNTTPSKYYLAWFNNHTTNSKTEQVAGPTVLGLWTTRTFDQFNNSNGETNQLFDSQPYPNTIDYKYSVISDPASTRNQNFITWDSKVKFDVKTRIKMSLNTGSNYKLTDTIQNVGTNFGKALDNVDSAVLVLKITNAIPIKALYRMTFWKSTNTNDTIAGKVYLVKNDSVNGTLNSIYKLNAPEINDDGSVKSGGVNPQIIQIGLNKTTISELRKTKFIVYSLVLEGEDTTVNGVQTTNPIHLTTKNNFGVKFGVFVKPNTVVSVGSTH